MSIQEQQQRLLDLEAIRDLPRRYACCVWRKDAAGAARLFAEDGFMQTGTGEPVLGHDALVDAFTKAFGGSDAHPFVHNHVIELSGDTATGFCCLDLRVRVDGKILIGSGDYHDIYVRRNNTWLFHSRKLCIHYQVPIATPATQAR